VNFTGFYLHTGYGIDYKKQTNAWVGQFNLDDRYSGFYHYFVIKNDDIQFYTHEYERVEKALKEDFGIEDEEEGEEKLEEINDVLQEFMYQKSADFIISSLFTYIKKLHTLKNKDLKGKIMMGYEDTEEDYYLGCYYWEVSIKHFPFYVDFQMDEEDGAAFDLLVKFEKDDETKPIQGGFEIRNAREFLGEEFTKRLWEEIKKQSKYRLRLLQLHI